MRRRILSATLSAFALLAASCTDSPTISGNTPGTGTIGIAPSFSAAAQQAYGTIAAFGLDVTSVRVVLTASDGSTQELVSPFPANQESISLELTVPGRSVGQTFTVRVELRNSDGQVLFSGSQAVVAQAVTFGGISPAPTAVSIQYTGPGVNVRTVSVSPVAPAITGTQTIPVTASAVDASGATVGDLLVRWTTSDATLATITQTGNATATVASTGRRGTVTISAITPTGVVGTARVAVTPVATRIAIISGGSQTASAGSNLAQPLIVEVQAADNLPVSGVPVTFRAVTAGGAVATAAATSDAAGRASTAMTLGRTAGSYQFEAASAGLSSVTVTQTATAAPAASLEVVSGSGQTATVGTALGAPFTVRVLDQFGTPVVGATVNWTRTTGGGSLGSASSVSGEGGIATNTYTLGNGATTESVQASLSGIPASAVSFSATGRAGPVANVTSAGSGQRGIANTLLAQPLVVRVTDSFGNPIQGVTVGWVVTGNSTTTATFQPPTVLTDKSGLASTAVNLGPTAGTLVVTAVVGGLTATYEITIEPGATSENNPGTLAGFVYDAVTQNALSGVSVTVKQGATIKIVSTTVTGGNFSTPPLPGGVYDVVLSLNGYVVTTIVGLVINGNTTAEAVPLVPSSPDPGSISGTIRDATTTAPVATVTVELRAGLNATTGTALQTVTTNTTGQYTFSGVSAGTYTVVARASGYTTGSKTGISVGATTTGNQNVSISPIGAAGNVRIVLTWRSAPRDLDSHLITPSGFHVFYGSRGSCSATPFACLDVDDTDGNGPETMTISQVAPGTYRYYIFNYSGELATGQSGGRVEVYIDNALAQTFSVPSGNGRTWTVFDLNGRTITPINTIDGSSSNGVNASARIAAPVPNADLTRIEADIRNHPKARNGPPKL